MKIDIEHSLFHSITPLIDYKERRGTIEERRARLKSFLDIGYLLSGRDLQKVFPENDSNQSSILFAIPDQS